VRTATIVLGEFRAAATDVEDLAETAAHLDRRVRRYLGDEDFVTATLAEIRPDGCFTVVSCGHPPPLVATVEGVTSVSVEPGLPLGMPLGPLVRPVAARGRLSPGDRMLLYTDGVLEARDERSRFVDLRDLAGSLRDGDLESLLDRMLADLHQAVGADRLGDDLALLVAEYQGPPVPGSRAAPDTSRASRPVPSRETS
jgi:serine phosphatase RsbU (regulator of sigma subunit)